MEEFLIIDGQQRLTTISLLLLAIYHFLNEAVEGAKILLLRQKVTAGETCKFLGDKQGYKHHDNGNQGKWKGKGAHHHEYTDYGNSTVDKLR